MHRACTSAPQRVHDCLNILLVYDKVVRVDIWLKPRRLRGVIQCHSHRRAGDRLAAHSRSQRRHSGFGFGKAGGIRGQTQRIHLGTLHVHSTLQTRYLLAGLTNEVFQVGDLV